MEEKLRELEERVNFLHSLTLRLVRWTNFQESHDDKEGEPESKTLEGDGGRRRLKRKAVAKKSTSGIRKNPLQSTDISFVAEDVQQALSNFLLEEAIEDDLDTSFAVKVEPVDDFDEEWPEEIVNFPSPSFDESFSMPEVVIEPSNEDVDSDFSPPSSEEENMTSSSSESEVQKRLRNPVETKRRRKKRSSASTPQRRKTEGSRRRVPGTKKVVVKSLTPDIQPPFVSLNRIDGVTLKEKYGLSEPKNRTHPWPCHKCSEEFPLFRLMRAHMKTAHPRVFKKKHFVCSFCQKEFKFNCHLVEHEATHTGERRHLCELCGYAAASNSSLASHMECMHQAEKKRQCDLCQKMFRTRGILAYHKKSEHRENPTGHDCSFCGKSFKLLYHLRRHVEDVHEKLRRYACGQCDKKFKRPTTLRRHVETHARGFKKNRGLNRDKPVKIVNKDIVDKCKNQKGSEETSKTEQVSATGESQPKDEIPDSSNSSQLCVEGEIQRTEDPTNSTTEAQINIACEL